MPHAGAGFRIIAETPSKFAGRRPSVRPNSRPGSAGFTLIELLVVIAVILVLGGLAFPAYQGVQNQAKKVQAKNDLVQIVTAVNAYYTEYGKYPVPGAATNTPDDYWIGEWNSADLFNVLRADGLSWDDVSGPNLNPRRVVFLTPPPAKGGNRPIGGIGTTDGKYYDPWGGVYRLRIDWDYNNNIVNPYSSGAGTNPLSFGVIGYSVGKDGASDADNNSGKFGTQGTNAYDDIVSWQ